VKPSLLLSASALLCFACKADDAAFLSLDRLCPSVAEEICNSQTRCCQSDEAPSDCLERVQDSCLEQRAEILKEDALTYDSEYAFQVREDLRAGLVECGDLFL